MSANSAARKTACQIVDTDVFTLKVTRPGDRFAIPPADIPTGRGVRFEAAGPIAAADSRGRRSTRGVAAGSGRATPRSPGRHRWLPSPAPAHHQAQATAHE